MRCCCLVLSASGVLAAPRLGKGWNLGNTLEGGGQSREEWIFESVKAKGFDWVRIPVKWGDHADGSGHIDQSFLATVEETVDWANKQGLPALINTHHEDWFDNGGSLDRLVNIWQQISSHFQSASDDQLVFEIFNEPNKMSLQTLNSMNAAVLPVIRQTNPTRLVFLGGLAQMGRWWINANPDAMTIPQDNNLGLTVHSYDPWAFAGDHPSSQSFLSSDEQQAHDQMAKLKSWAQTHGIQQVVMNEFGVTNQQPNKDARLRYYKVNSEACVENGQGYAVWDDNGYWQILNRKTRTWQDDVLAQLAGGSPTPSPSPTPTPSPGGASCCWNGCNDASSCTTDPFCLASSAQCGKCGGQWCPAGGSGCCFDGCNPPSSCTTDAFCLANSAQCGKCGGQWCGSLRSPNVSNEIIV